MEEKKKIHYNVLFVPDNDSVPVKHISLRLEIIIAFFAALAFLIIAALAYCFILTGELKASNEKINTLISQTDMLTQEKEKLVTENEELQDQVAILSDTVNDKVQKEEEREAEIAQASVPTGFPLKGTASYNEEETQFDGNPITVFNASEGMSVLAVANGTVSSIAGNSDVGYIVMIDHGNGYFSIYRNGSKPKVKEGDEVTSATELFNIEAGHEKLGYQIIENDVYIDPLQLMEIYG